MTINVNYTSIANVHAKPREGGTVYVIKWNLPADNYLRTTPRIIFC
jgi:hypothetical protein